MPEPHYDTSAPVLVTGATGYVAGWIVRRLLETGFTVHAAVRDPDRENKVSHLKALDRELPGTIRFFQSDLLVDGSYTEAMAACRVVFHTASPMAIVVEDPQRDLLDPAVRGTRNVLETASATDSVERVVVTSSVAAMIGDNTDISALPGGVITEDNWNTSSSPNHLPYSHSKALAERAAWEVAETQSRWRLVTVNPGMVLGPAASKRAPDCFSFSVMRQFGDGTLKAGAPPYEIGIVDVQDVAEAHLRAGFTEHAEGRHLVFSDSRSLLEIGDTLRAKFGSHWPFPRRELPKWLIWLIGPLMDKALTRTVVSRNLNHPWRGDNSKSRRALGMTYRPLEPGITGMFQQLIDTGSLARK